MTRGLRATCVQAVAAVLILVAFGCCAWAEEWTREELAGPRLFIGLARGGLISDQESHFRSFVRLQKLVRSMTSRLRGAAKVIRVGDYSWTGRDDWKPLARRGYTHYVIAVPQEPMYGRLKWVDVSWMAGQISSAGEIVLEAELLEPTRITIPDEGEPPEVIEPTSVDRIAPKLNAASEVEAALRVLFPEFRSEHKFAIRCIAPVDDTTAARFNAARFTVMSYLSHHLETPPWASLARFSADSAPARCQEKQDDRLDADLMIGGWLSPQKQQKKNLIKAIVEIEDLLPKRRRQYARVNESVGSGPRRYPPKLDQFCVEQFQISQMDSLVLYIRVHGLKIEGIKYEPQFRCP